MLKIKPDHNVSGNVNAVILSSQLLVLCVVQAFVLSDFFCKPQEQEGSRGCVSAGLSETLSILQI